MRRARPGVVVQLVLFFDKYQRLCVAGIVLAHEPQTK